MLFLLIIVFSGVCYYFAKRRVIFLSSRYRIKPNSLPQYYGANLAIWNFIASSIMLLILSICKILKYKVNYFYAYLGIASVFIILLIYIISALKLKFKAQAHCENLFKIFLSFAAFISVMLTISIIFTILFEAIKFFQIIPIEHFLLGTKWSPQSNDSQLIYGVIPVFTGTLLITLIAMSISIPLGLLSAIYLAEYSKSSMKNFIKPYLEILAGVPTVVYGYFAVLIISPGIRKIGEILDFEVSTESALSAGIVMGMMIIPFILSLCEDAIS
jgi:phosphate transport system permease protein